MIIEKHETKLTGTWSAEEKDILKDDVTKRIEWLTSHHLKKVATDASGWDILYQDPNDDRYWELLYLNSGMHGGGPPSLINISFEDAKNKYHLSSTK